MWAGTNWISAETVDVTKDEEEKLTLLGERRCLLPDAERVGFCSSWNLSARQFNRKP